LSTRARREMLDEQVNSHMQTLVQIQSTEILSKVLFLDKLRILNGRNAAEGKLSAVISAEDMSACMFAFDKFLSSSG